MQNKTLNKDLQSLRKTACATADTKGKMKTDAWVEIYFIGL